MKKQKEKKTSYQDEWGSRSKERKERDKAKRNKKPRANSQKRYSYE